jgi:hypothetical protein
MDWRRRGSYSSRRTSSLRRTWVRETRSHIDLPSVEKSGLTWRRRLMRPVEFGEALAAGASGGRIRQALILGLFLLARWSRNRKAYCRCLKCAPFYNPSPPLRIKPCQHPLPPIVIAKPRRKNSVNCSVYNHDQAQASFWKLGNGAAGDAHNAQENELRTNSGVFALPTGTQTSLTVTT